MTNAVSTSPKSPGFDTLLSKLEPELVECGDLRVKWFKWSFVLARPHHPFLILERPFTQHSVSRSSLSGLQLPLLETLASYGKAAHGPRVAVVNFTSIPIVLSSIWAESSNNAKRYSD